jgi:hypothetical protein
MPELNDRLFVRKFAWLPKNIFPQYEGQIKKKDFIWLKRYYKVYKYMLVTWRLRDSEFYNDWVWVGNCKTI